MDLLSRFKKDYFNYLISIILPALIAGISVPLFKHLLGSKGYGEFSIYYNATLIGSAITTGWITQSIYRFYPSIKNKKIFAKFSISISNKTQLLFFLPLLFFVWYTKNDLLLGILICLAIFMNSMQFSYIAITQSSFLSRKTIYSESIRTVSYIILALIFLLIIPADYLYVLFIANIISFSLSVFYLHRQTRQFFLQNNSKDDKGLTRSKLTRQFLHYGGPLSMWVVFSYLLPYVDKLLILHNLGSQAQGNYQAIFDLLSRGLTVLISPVIISLYPLLSHAYEKSENTEIKQLMMRIILLEVGAFFVSAILYWWFGADLLFIILKVPNTSAYRLMGFVVLAGTFVWQIAMVIHQKYVLKLKSRYLLFIIAIAFFVQLIFYWFARKSDDPIIYPLGYLIAASMYLFFVSISHLSTILRSLFIPVKSYFAKLN
jgi:O-antigen/teichoic acid export membrane protein